MRGSLIACYTALVLLSGIAHAADDMQAKCQQKLSAHADKVEQVKQLGGLLGSEKVDDTVAKVEKGCDQLGGAGSSGQAAETSQEQSEAQGAAETLKGVGSLFGK
jgi:hypothetical protein